MPRSVRLLRGVGTVGVVAGALCGCAGVALEQRPEQIPALEQAAARAPRDAGTATRLGVAYYAADRWEDARRTLQQAIDAGARDGAAYLYLGLAHEELEDWGGARAAYDSYLQTGTSQRVKSQIRGRLGLVARKEMRQQARLALEQESVLSDQPPTPRTIAVLPFTLRGLSADMQPLQTALADMIITDLSLVRLQSLERVRVQSLIDEMVLTQAGLTTRETGARMGRLLKAEHVVHGVLSGAGDELVMDATVLNTAQQTTRGEVNRRGAAERIFDLEKQIVFGIIDALGIQVTAREREQITSNRTGSLLAFLAYGRGLEALDRGDYGEALTQFEQASQLDPRFGAARSQHTQAREITTAASTATGQVAQVGVVEIEVPGTAALAQDIVDQVNHSPASTVTATPTTASAAPQERKPTTEPQQTPPLSQARTVRVPIVIPRPGGGP